MYSSDLGRARTTLNLAMSRFPAEKVRDVVPTQLVREVSYGIFEDLPIALKLDEIKAIRAEQRGVSIDAIEDDRESPDSVLQRQLAFLQLVVDDLNAEQIVWDAGDINVLCLSHGGFIKRFLNQVCNIHLEEKIENCSTSVITVSKAEDGSFVCVADKNEINLLNDSTHLP